MDPLLEFACTLADASGEHLRGAFRRPFAVEAKALLDISLEGAVG